MPAHKRNQREKGVALLFSLGILGLMTVLALTFASVSMTSQQTAKNATNKASARFLASSIPAHIASLLYQDAYFTATNPANTPANTPALAHMPLYSKTQSGPKSYDWIWKLAIRDASLKSAIYEMDVLNYTTLEQKEQNPTWQYISRKENGEDKIVARIAYVAVPSEALIDLNSTLLMEDGTQPTAYTRRGISICGELEPVVLFNQIPKESGGDDTFHFKESEAKTRAFQDRFTSYDEIQRYIAGGLAANVLKPFNRRFVRAFAPNSVRYPEVFTLPGTTEVYHRIDLVQLSKKIAVLSENSKRKDALNSILSDTGKSMLIPNLKESPFSEANSPFRISNGESGEGPAYPQIPWFREFNTTKLSGFADSETKRNQIVANFLDFFTPVKVTSDDGEETKIAPTSDIDPNSWSVEDGSPTPKYTGLKKTPYICGFGAVIQAVATYGSEAVQPEGKPQQYKYPIKITAEIALSTEVINMYTNMEDTNSLEIVVRGRMSLEGTLGGAKFTSQIELNPANVEVTPKSKEEKTQTSRRYIVQTLKVDAIPICFPNLSGSYVPKDGALFTSENVELPKDEIPNLTITAIKLQPRIILKWNGLPVDFADLSTTDAVTFSTTEEETGPQLNGSIYFAAARRVSDPRHNLVPSAWNGNWICAKAPAAEILTVPALLNETVDSSAGTTDAGKLYTSTYETEEGESGEASTLANLASDDLPNVYLRGSPIGNRTSFHAWELAFIHRAAPWENFNFTKYAANEKGELKNKGGSDYVDGDLGLLDQLKLTWYTDSAEETSSEKKEKTDSPKLYSYGKLNVNELTDKNYHAFLALLLKAVPEKNNPGETEITYKDVTLSTTAPAAYFQQKANSSTPFKSRVQIFHSLGGEDLWAGVSESDKAKLFPSLIFLLDAEPTVLPRRVYVLGIAQTIKDVSGTYSKNWGSDYWYSSGFQTPEGVKVSPAQVPSSGTISDATAAFNTYDIGADQITGEQKVFSVLEREYTLQPYSTSNCPKWTIKEVKYADY